MATWLAEMQTQFLGFLLILVRVSGILIFAPFFGSERFPLQVKIPLIFAVSLLMGFTLGFPSAGVAAWDWVPAILGELMIGLGIGFIGMVAFGGVQLAGSIIGTQMGFGIVNVIDPMSSVQISIIGQYKFALAILVLLVIRGHHLILLALQESFQVCPLGDAWFTPAAAANLLHVGGMVFTVGVQVSAPIVIALLIVSIGSGVIARTVPQVNFLIFGFAFRIWVGLFILLLGLVFFMNYMTDVMGDWPGLFRSFMGAMRQ